MTEYCNYGDTLETMLRDRLVSGINDKRILSRLLQEGDKLTFIKAKELAIALESAEKDVKDLQVNPSPIEVPATSNVHVVQPPSQVCHQCGGKHLPSACRFRGAECYKCHQRAILLEYARVKRRGKVHTRFK